MKISKLSKTLIVITLVSWILIGFVFYQNANATSKKPEKEHKMNIFSGLDLFNKAFFLLKRNYVDTLYVDDMVVSAINGILEELDPHTNLFDPQDFKEFTTSTEGEFGGLGISIVKQGDYITVVSPIEGTPAYKMGILAGDKIVKVDTTNIVGITTKDAIKLMRGPKGTKVKITIQRPGVKKELVFEIIRDIIKIHSVPYVFKIKDDIGYIRIRQFSKNTTEEFVKALDKLESQGIKGMIVDLRFNPGGLLNQAVNTVNQFIGPKKLVVYTKGRIESANEEYYTKLNVRRKKYPVIVLINEASASAAEIFAGTLQDYDKALIMGKTSFGKGSVQRLFPLPNNYGIKITVAKYYIPSGRCIHKDLNDKILMSKRKISKTELEKMKKEEEEKEKKLIYHTLNKHRVVYGGGGIAPDIEVEADKLSNFGVELRRKNEIFKFAVDYMIDHENEVTKDFVPSDTLVNKFLEKVKQDSIEYTQADLDSTYSWIKNTIRSEIIGKKFGPQESYKISINEDNQLQEAVKVFEKFDSLNKMFKYAQKLSKEKAENKE